MPDAEFLSPNAPFPCEIAPMGFQWFGFEDRSPEMLLGGARLGAEILGKYKPTGESVGCLPLRQIDSMKTALDYVGAGDPTARTAGRRSSRRFDTRPG